MAGLAEALEAGGEALWQPNPGPQVMALGSAADELFYGGSAGGGKTDLLLGLALTQHRRSVIFRRELKQARAILDRAREIVGNRGAVREMPDARITTYDGRLLELSGVQHPGDELKWQGIAHDLKAFDELPQIREAQYRFLIGWNRSAAGQRCRIVGAGNPPTTPEGQWVVRRWAPWLDRRHPNRAKPGELRWFVQLEDGTDEEVSGPEPVTRGGKTLAPRSRTFVPAALVDNPHLASSGYEAVLDSLPEPLRSQMRDGNFEVGIEDDPWQVIPSAWVRAAFDRWTEHGGAGVPMDALGVDVARGGRDQTVLVRRHGAWFAPLIKRPGKETPDGQSVAQLVMRYRTGAAVANVDVIGVGSSAYDILRLQEVPCAAVNFAAGSDARDRSGVLSMANVRAAAYWSLREALDPERGDAIALPPDEELESDLVSPKWSLSMRGVKVEAKEEIAARIGRSTDCGDAIALAAWVGSLPAEWDLW